MLRRALTRYAPSGLLSMTKVGWYSSKLRHYPAQGSLLQSCGTARMKIAFNPNYGSLYFGGPGGIAAGTVVPAGAAVVFG